MPPFFLFYSKQKALATVLIARAFRFKLPALAHGDRLPGDLPVTLKAPQAPETPANLPEPHL